MFGFITGAQLATLSSRMDKGTSVPGLEQVGTSNCHSCVSASEQGVTLHDWENYVQHVMNMKKVGGIRAAAPYFNAKTAFCLFRH